MFVFDNIIRKYDSCAGLGVEPLASEVLKDVKAFSPKNKTSESKETKVFTPLVGESISRSINKANIDSLGVYNCWNFVWGYISRISCGNSSKTHSFS